MSGFLSSRLSPALSEVEKNSTPPRRHHPRPPWSLGFGARLAAWLLERQAPGRPTAVTSPGPSETEAASLAGLTHPDPFVGPLPPATRKALGRDPTDPATSFRPPPCTPLIPSAVELCRRAAGAEVLWGATRPARPFDTVLKQGPRPAHPSNRRQAP